MVYNWLKKPCAWDSPEIPMGFPMEIPTKNPIGISMGFPYDPPVISMGFQMTISMEYL